MNLRSASTASNAFEANFNYAFSCLNNDPQYTNPFNSSDNEGAFKKIGMFRMFSKLLRKHVTIGQMIIKFFVTLDMEKMQTITSLP